MNGLLKTYKIASFLAKIRPTQVFVQKDRFSAAVCCQKLGQMGQIFFFRHKDIRDIISLSCFFRHKDIRDIISLSCFFFRHKDRKDIFSLSCFFRLKDRKDISGGKKTKRKSACAPVLLPCSQSFVVLGSVGCCYAATPWLLVFSGILASLLSGRIREGLYNI